MKDLLAEKRFKMKVKKIRNHGGKKSNPIPKPLKKILKKLQKFQKKP